MWGLLLRSLLMPPAPHLSPESRAIHVSFRPLIGGPAFLPIHVEMLHDGRVYDFLPQTPQDPTTAITLLSGGEVDGIVRCRPVRRMRGRLIGHTKRSPEELQQFVAQHPLRLSLVSNSCWTFVAALADFAMVSPDGGGAIDT